MMIMMIMKCALLECTYVPHLMSELCTVYFVFYNIVTNNEDKSA